MHWIHSSLIRWRINCPVANTFKFSNLESWESIRCIAVVSDQSNFWHFDSVLWCRNSAFLFIYFPGQWTKLCLQQDTIGIASVRFIDQIDTRERENTNWCEERMFSSECEHKVLKLSGFTFNYSWTNLCTLRNPESFGHCQAQVQNTTMQCNVPITECRRFVILVCLVLGIEKYCNFRFIH